MIRSHCNIGVERGSYTKNEFKKNSNKLHSVWSILCPLRTLLLFLEENIFSFRPTAIPNLYSWLITRLSFHVGLLILTFIYIPWIHRNVSVIVIPHVSFLYSDWSIERVTFLNVTRFLQGLKKGGWHSKNCHMREYMRVRFEMRNQWRPSRHS